MGRGIVRHAVDGRDLYLVWSTVVDAPITFGGTLEQLREYWRGEFGRAGLADLDRDIERGDWTRTVEWAAQRNRAGEDETSLSAEQIVEHYFVRRDPDHPRPRGRAP